MDSTPIFVHSLFRTGSTYVFNAFRRSNAGYWCYQEPLHEYIRYVAKAPERLLDLHFDLEATLRHPHLEKPYFWELYEVRDAITPLFKKQLSYDSFFARDGHESFEDVTRYLQCLLDNARGRAMFQCCRTFGRVAAIHKFFGGKHIHLWRNPWDQWWSYQVDSYFDVTTQLILNALELPGALRSVKEMCGITNFHDPNIENEIIHAANHRLPAKISYSAFYALWLYSLIETEKATDVSLNIDTLSSSAEYQRQILGNFIDGGIVDVDFSDCRIVQTAFGSRDLAFFEKAENQVHDLFVANGYKEDDVGAAMELRDNHKPALRHSVTSLTGDAVRIREVALKQIDRLAESQRVVQEQNLALDRNRRFTATIESDRAALRETLDAANEDLRANRAQLTYLTEEYSTVKTRERTLGLELEAMIAQANGLENELSQARCRIDELHLEMTKWHGVANDINRHLQAVYATRSWRLTAPLRNIQRRLRRLDFSTNAGFSRLSSLFKRIQFRLLSGITRYVQRRPEVKRTFIRLLIRFPRRYQQLRSIALSHAVRLPDAPPAFDRKPSPGGSTNDVALVQESAQPPSVLRVYRRLMDARKSAANGLL